MSTFGGFVGGMIVGGLLAGGGSRYRHSSAANMPFNGFLNRKSYERRRAKAVRLGFGPEFDEVWKLSYEGRPFGQQVGIEAHRAFYDARALHKERSAPVGKA